jgi:hypothetical protein
MSQNIILGGDIMKTSRRSATIAIAASMLFGATAFAAPITFPLALTGRGSGNEIGSAGSCNGSGNSCTGATGSCECYQFSGTATLNNNIGTVLATTNFLLVEESIVDGLECVGAHGVLNLTEKANAMNVLALSYDGLDCLDDSASEFVFNGSYTVDDTASQGKFAKALGSGTFTAGVQDSGTITLGNINGTLQLVK